MADKKITKREVIGMMMNEEFVKANEVYMAYLSNELDILDRRKISKAESTKKSENEGIKNTLLEVLVASEKGLTVTDIQKSNAELGALSNQKISALLKQMVDDNIVAKKTDKKKSYFSVA